MDSLHCCHRFCIEELYSHFWGCGGNWKFKMWIIQQSCWHHCIDGQVSSYFGLKLALRVFSATEQVSITLQHHDSNAQEALAAVKSAEYYLNRQRSDDAFNLFYDLVLQEAAEKGLQQPTLPRQRKIPRRIDNGGENHIFSSPKEFSIVNTLKFWMYWKENYQDDLISPHLLFWGKLKKYWLIAVMMRRILFNLQK